MGKGWLGYAKLIPELNFNTARVCEMCGGRNDRPYAAHCKPCMEVVNNERARARRRVKKRRAKTVI